MQDSNVASLFSAYAAETLALAALSLALSAGVQKLAPKLSASLSPYLPFAFGLASYAAYGLIFGAQKHVLSGGAEVGGCALLLRALLDRFVGGSVTVSLPAENKLMTVTGILSGITDLESAKKLAARILAELDKTSDTMGAVALCHDILKSAKLEKSEKELLNISCIILGALSFIKL